MKKSSILYCLLLSLLAVSCKKEKIDLYDGAHYVQFTAAQADTITLSFFFYAGRQDVDVQLPVKLVGLMPGKDLGYRVEMDTAGTTALQKNYTLPGTYSFSKGQSLDSAVVTIHNSPELATNEYLLALKIVSTAEVLRGQTNYTRRIIKINDRVSKPAWWDVNMDRFYLGVYSEKKFRKFMEVTGVGDLSKLNTSEQRVQMLKFKYYLMDMQTAGTPVLETDGTDMLSTVPLIG
jgi:hypothetical protein